jgi:hypothetical protein
MLLKRGTICICFQMEMQQVPDKYSSHIFQLKHRLQPSSFPSKHLTLLYFTPVHSRRSNHLPPTTDVTRTSQNERNHFQMPFSLLTTLAVLLERLQTLSLWPPLLQTFPKKSPRTRNPANICFWSTCIRRIF